MHGEVPEFKRCCFCIPLRRGLIGWGYIKLLVDLLTMIYFGFLIYSMVTWSWRRPNTEDTVIFTFLNICLPCDISFTITFIVAGHMKSVKLLKVSYIYNIVWLGLLALGSCYMLDGTLRMAYRMWSYYSIYYPDYHKYIIIDLLVSFGVAFSLMFVQVYIILLVRSEMIKLKHQSLEMQFTNLTVTGDSQCTLKNAPELPKYTEKNVQDPCTEKNQVV